MGERARRNLEFAYGEELDEEARERILRGVFRHSARLFREWGRLSGARGPADPRSRWLDEEVRLDPSIEHLDAALAGGRGALVVTAHIGNWELLAARLGRRGQRGAVVGLRRPRDPASDWLIEMRRAHGVETIPQDAPPRRMLEVLRRGEVLGILSDLEVRRLDGEFLPFFGRPALTMTAPAALVRAARAPLLPLRCVASPRGGYTLFADEPLELDPSLEPRAARRDLLQRQNRLFERWIRADPEQWAWHQHRWRTAPGEYEILPLAERRRRDLAGGDEDRAGP